MGSSSTIVRMVWYGTLISVCMCATSFLAGPQGVLASSNILQQGRAQLWAQLIDQASLLKLPTRFLSEIPQHLVAIEFEDLRSFAAEYHPEDHRMVLNRSLSLNRAGRALRPLSTLTHQELGTLYHELFHAYMDVLGKQEGDQAVSPPSKRLVQFAHEQQQCRYQDVLITPILQRKNSTERRFLTERESWEALNETWAVFVGWSTWTTLDLRSKVTQLPKGIKNEATDQQWGDRLRQADQEGQLIGYYEPEHPQERAVTHKRYLAPTHRISSAEAALLLEVVMEQSKDQAQSRVQSLTHSQSPREKTASCTRPS